MAKKEKTHYEVETKCTNCLNYCTYEIRKGLAAEEYFKIQKCHDCNCLTVKVYDEIKERGC